MEVRGQPRVDPVPRAAQQVHVVLAGQHATRLRRTPRRGNRGQPVRPPGAGRDGAKGPRGATVHIGRYLESQRAALGQRFPDGRPESSMEAEADL